MTCRLELDAFLDGVDKVLWEYWLWKESLLEEAQSPRCEDRWVKLGETTEPA
jgi:hypothetical protein